MILRALVDKMRRILGQSPVVDLQPEQEQPKLVIFGHEYELSCFSNHVIDQPKKIKLYNVYLHHRKNKSQKRNWKKYSKRRVNK